MWPDKRHLFALAVLCLGPLAGGAGPAPEVAAVEVREFAREHGAGTPDVVYPLAVLDAAGWDPAQVEQAARGVEAIFAQCDVRVTAGPVHRLRAGEEFRQLDAAMQSRLLAELPPQRPLAVLIDATTGRDVAYSYLRSAPTDSRGTAWVTRDHHPACVGPLLAHELGHILLDSARHSSDRRNLMFPACSVSNVAGSRPGTELTAAQCERLRAR